MEEPRPTDLSDSELICIEESTSKFGIQVVTNRVLIRGGEARIFKTTSATAYDALSEESVVKTAVFDTECNSDSLVCVLIKENKHKEEITGATTQEIIETDDSLKIDDEPDWESTSDEEDFKETDDEDPSDLPSTLKLLEQVSFRILGEKTVTIPEIEKVEEQEKEEVLLRKTSVKHEVLKEEEEAENRFKEYLDTVAFSEKFVDNVLQSAKQMCKSKYKKKVALVGFSKHHRKQSIVWPSIKQFNEEVGLDSIDMYIRHGFVLKEAWKYRIIFLIGQSDNASDFYLYEVKFSIPTATYPICQATVSVFFTFEVSRVIPKEAPVRVTFTLESLRRVMVPGEVEVNDKSLLMVLSTKLAVYKELFF